MYQSLDWNYYMQCTGWYLGNVSNYTSDSLTFFYIWSFRNLQSNQLNGFIPSSIGSLTSLTRLYVQMYMLGCNTDRWLYSNKLTGSIPSSIGSLTSLKELYVLMYMLDSNNDRHLYDNQLTGSIPSSIGSLTYLTSLYVHRLCRVLIMTGSCITVWQNF